MKKNISWLSAIIIVLAVVCLIDLNVNGHYNAANKIPELKYSIIGISIILVLGIVQIIIRKGNSKK